MYSRAATQLLTNAKKKTSMINPVAIRGARMEKMVNPYAADWKEEVWARDVARPTCMAVKTRAM